MNASLLNRVPPCPGNGDERHVPRQYLKSTIQYFFEIKKGGDIDEQQFTSLVSLALANYIESELIAHIQKLTEDKLFQFLDEF
jgi:hypothetical protein